MSQSNNSKNFEFQLNSLKDKLEKFTNFVTYNSKTNKSKIDTYNPIQSLEQFKNDNPNPKYLKVLNSNHSTYSYYSKTNSNSEKDNKLDKKTINRYFADVNYAQTNYVRLHQNNLFFIEKPDHKTLDFIENLLEVSVDSLYQQIEQHTDELLIQNVLLPKFLNSIVDIQTYRNNLANFYQTTNLAKDTIASITYEWLAELTLELTEQQASAIDYQILGNEFLLQLYWLALQPEQVTLIYQKGLVNSLKAPKYIFDHLHTKIFDNRFAKPINETLNSLEHNLTYNVGYTANEYEYIVRPFFNQSLYHKFKIDLNDYGLQSLPNFVKFSNLFQNRQQQISQQELIDQGNTLVTVNPFAKYWIEVSHNPNLSFRHYLNLEKFFKTVFINQVVPTNLLHTIDWQNQDIASEIKANDIIISQDQLTQILQQNHHNPKTKLSTYSAQDLIDCYQLYGVSYFNFVISKIDNFFTNFNHFVLNKKQNNQSAKTKSEFLEIFNYNYQSNNFNHDDNTDEKIVLDETNANNLVIKVNKTNQEKNLNNQPDNQSETKNNKLSVSEANLKATVKHSNSLAKTTAIQSTPQISNQQSKSSVIREIFEDINKYSIKNRYKDKVAKTQSVQGKSQTISSSLDNKKLNLVNTTTDDEFDHNRNAQYFFFNFNHQLTNHNLKDNYDHKHNSKSSHKPVANQLFDNQNISKYLIKYKPQYLRNANTLIEQRQKSILRSRLLNELVYGNFYQLDDKYGELFSHFYNLIKSLLVFKNLSDKLPKSHFLQLINTNPINSNLNKQTTSNNQQNLTFILNSSSNQQVQANFNRLSDQFNPSLLLNFEIDLNATSVQAWHNALELDLSQIKYPNQYHLQLECKLITDLNTNLTYGKYYLVKAKHHNHYKFIFLSKNTENQNILVQTCHVLRNDFNINTLLSDKYYLAATNSYLQANLHYSNQDAHSHFPKTNFDHLGLIANKVNFAKDRKAFALYQHLPAFNHEQELIQYLEQYTNLSPSLKFFIKTMPYVLKDNTTCFMGKNLVANFNSCFLSNYACTILDESWYASKFGEKAKAVDSSNYHDLVNGLVNIKYYTSLSSFNEIDNFSSLAPQIIVSQDNLKLLTDLSKTYAFNGNYQINDLNNSTKSLAINNTNNESNYEYKQEHNLVQVPNYLFFEPELFSVTSLQHNYNLNAIQDSYADSGFITQQIYNLTHSKSSTLDNDNLEYNLLATESSNSKIYSQEIYNNLATLLEKYDFIALVDNLVVSKSQIEEQAILSTTVKDPIRNYINQIPKDPSLLFHYLTNNYTLEPTYSQHNYKDGANLISDQHAIANLVAYLDFSKTKLHELNPNDLRTKLAFDSELCISQPLFKVNYKKVLQVYQQQLLTQEFMSKHSSLHHINLRLAKALIQTPEQIDNLSNQNQTSKQDSAQNINQTTSKQTKVSIPITSNNVPFNFNQINELLLYGQIHDHYLTYPTVLDQPMDQVKIGKLLQQRLKAFIANNDKICSYALTANIYPTISYQTSFNDLLPTSELVKDLYQLEYRYIIDQDQKALEVKASQRSYEQLSYLKSYQEIKKANHLLEVKRHKSHKSNQEHNTKAYRDLYDLKTSKKLTSFDEDYLNFRDFLRYYNLIMPRSQHLPICCELAMIAPYNNYFNYNYYQNFSSSLRTHFIEPFIQQLNHIDHLSYKYTHQQTNAISEFFKNELNGKFYLYAYLPEISKPDPQSLNNLNLRKLELNSLIFSSYAQTLFSQSQAKLMAFYSSLNLAQKIMFKIALFNYDLTSRL